MNQNEEQNYNRTKQPSKFNCIYVYNKSYKCGSKSMLISLCILSNLSKAFREEKKNYTAPGEGKKVCIWDHTVTNHERG